jgi:hypothetical protein
LARQLLTVSEILVTNRYFKDSGNHDSEQRLNEEIEVLREENEVYSGSLEKSELIIKNLKAETDSLTLQLDQLRVELTTVK